MLFRFENNKIVLNKDKNKLDKFVIKFIKKLDINYVLVSGYVSILFERSRTTEDVDILIERISFDKFKELYSRLKNTGFNSVTTDDEKELFNELNKESTSIRFCDGDRYIPNIEVKFAKYPEEKEALTQPQEVIFGADIIKISPLELQIAYKLYLGKESNIKDVEDARHLYNLFKENLDRKKLEYWIKKFNCLEMVKYLE